ncbi:MAG: hypothetical protein RL607_2420 [Bacteroidota bacterium]|jgi:hypothetical protein
MIPCLFKQTFGFDCMGCGMQRAIYLLSQGRFWDAFQMYPALYSLIILLGFVVKFAIKPNPKNGRTVILLAIANAVIIIVAYLIKMRNFFF